MIGLSGVISIARISPGKLDAKAIRPSEPSAEYLFWKIDSPENIRPIDLPIPPVACVSIRIFDDIRLTGLKMANNDRKLITGNFVFHILFLPKVNT